MDQILGYFVEQPRRLISIGRAAFTAGMLVIVVGLFGLVARTGGSAVRTLGKASAAAAPSLAEVYPDFGPGGFPKQSLAPCRP